MNRGEIQTIKKILCQWVEDGRLSFLEAHTELENCKAIAKACSENGWTYDFTGFRKQYEFAWSIKDEQAGGEIINSYSTYVIAFISGYNHGKVWG